MRKWPALLVVSFLVGLVYPGPQAYSQGEDAFTLSWEAPTLQFTLAASNNLEVQQEIQVDVDTEDGVKIIVALLAHSDLPLRQELSAVEIDTGGTTQGIGGTLSPEAELLTGYGPGSFTVRTSLEMAVIWVHIEPLVPTQSAGYGLVRVTPEQDFARMLIVRGTPVHTLLLPPEDGSYMVVYCLLNDTAPRGALNLGYGVNFMFDDQDGPNFNRWRGSPRVQVYCGADQIFGATEVTVEHNSEDQSADVFVALATITEEE
jgi:hypothetical protein